MATFQELLDQYAILAYEKQHRLSSLIGEHEWVLDVEKARVTFNNKLMFRVQFLGSESGVTNSWLWADANQKVGFPGDSLQYCRKIRGLAAAHGLEEFVCDSFQFIEEVGRPTGHTLAMVATCLGGASCYYRGPHKHGAVYFVVFDGRIDSQGDLDLVGFSEAFNEQLWMPGNVKTRVMSYLSSKGYVPKGFNEDEVSCRLHTGEKIYLSFKRTADGRMEIDYSPGDEKRE